MWEKAGEAGMLPVNMKPHPLSSTCSRCSGEANWRRANFFFFLRKQRNFWIWSRCLDLAESTMQAFKENIAIIMSPVWSQCVAVKIKDVYNCGKVLFKKPNSDFNLLANCILAPWKEWSGDLFNRAGSSVSHGEADIHRCLWNISVNSRVTSRIHLWKIYNTKR